MVVVFISGGIVGENNHLFPSRRDSINLLVEARDHPMAKGCAADPAVLYIGRRFKLNYILVGNPSRGCTGT